MKNTFCVIAITLLCSSTGVANQVKTFEIMNAKVEQGDTVVVRINPQWQGNSVCISVMNKQFLPNANGYVFIGIGVDIRPARYSVVRVECGRGFQLDPLPEYLEVVRKNFRKTRTAGRGKSSRPRQGPEINSFDVAFGQANRSISDLTGGQRFIYPMDVMNPDPRLILTHPFGNIYRNNNSLFHSGIDFKVNIGTPVKAVNRGIVVLVTNNYSKEGNMIILNHGKGTFSVYMHLSSIGVAQGNLVERGDQIGFSGDSGTARGNPHLHWNMMAIDLYSDKKFRYQGYVDPLIFIDTVNQYLTR